MLLALVACSPSREQVFGAKRWTLGFPAVNPMMQGLAVGPAGPVLVSVRHTDVDSAIRLDQFAAPHGALLWTIDLQARAPNQVSMPHATTDRDHNVVVAGAFAGTVNFGGDTVTSAVPSGFIAKFDVNGNVQWVRTFPGCGIAIAADSRGRAYVFDDLATLTAFDSDGSLRWARKLGNDPGLSAAVAATSNDDIVVGTARNDELVVWLSPDGNTRWSGTLASSNNLALAADLDGHIVAADDTSITLLDALGFGLWQSNSQLAQPFYSVTVRADHTVIVAGEAGLEAFSRDGAPLDAVLYDSTPSLLRPQVAATYDGAVAFADVEVDFGPLLTILE